MYQRKIAMPGVGRRLLLMTMILAGTQVLITTLDRLGCWCRHDVVVVAVVVGVILFCCSYIQVLRGSMPKRTGCYDVANGPFESFDDD